MQLVAYGAQDVYLTGQPKVTFFQAVYKRYTNFAMEAIQQTVNGSATSGSRVSVTIARNGDLVGDMWLQLQPNSAAMPSMYSNNTLLDGSWLAERAISAVELTIGGQRIDKHYQTWFRLYAEVFLGESQKIAYGKMASVGNPTYDANTSVVFLPLIFFFNRNPGLFLPLIALQYHEVRLDFDLAAGSTTGYSNWFGTNPIQVWANYVYLDTEERRRFAQKGHEYLIEQVQHTGGDSMTTSATTSSAQTVRLTLNHPVKELIWCYQSPLSSDVNGLWNFSQNVSSVNVTSSADPGISASLTAEPVPGYFPLPHAVGAPRLIYGADPTIGSIYMVEEGLSGAPGATQGARLSAGPLSTFKLILNGQDRFAVQNAKYFNQYQPFKYHSGTPYPGIYVYSFALKPEEHQPSGTCNFSRIDNAQVSAVLKAYPDTATRSTLNQKLYAVNYNILRIQSGMGGLAFSN